MPSPTPAHALMPSPAPPQHHDCPRGPRTQLHKAVCRGAVEGTLALLSKGSCDIDARDPDGATPLMLSAVMGCSRIVEILLDKGANASIAEEEGITALHVSAEHGHLEVTKMLTKAGAPVDAATTGGSTPLHLTARQGHWEVMVALIDAGADPDSRLPADGETPLFAAACRGHVEATRVLLRAQANAMLTSMDSRGTSFCPLEVATYHGYSGVVGELVQQRGIEECGGRSGGVDALSMAAEKGRVDILGILSNAGVVDTGIALVLATASGHLASVKFLLHHQHQDEGRSTSRRSAYVNSTCGRYGAPPLLHAIGFGGCCSPRIARLLVDAGASTSSVVRGKDKNGVAIFNHTPLVFVDMYLLHKKIGGGRNATEGQLNSLEAIRRLLLLVKAVHAVSWLWPTNVSGVTCTVESPAKIRNAPAPPTAMALVLQMLRLRASARRRVLAPAVFRYSKEP